MKTSPPNLCSNSKAFPLTDQAQIPTRPAHGSRNVRRDNFIPCNKYFNVVVVFGVVLFFFYFVVVVVLSWLLTSE